MEGKGLRALLCVLMVLAGCSLAVVPIVSADTADTGSGADAHDEFSQEQLQQLQTQEETEDETPDSQTGSDRLTDASEIHIDTFVHENGSATFEVDYRFENDTESGWETLREDIEANTDEYVDAEESAWGDTVADSENATEREMGIEDLAIETDTSSAPQDLGHVKVTFEWTAFAYVELNRIEVDESLTGMTLMQDTTMELFPPDGYVISNGNANGNENGNENGNAADDTDESTTESLFWHGDNVDFSNEPPTVVMIENGDASETTTEPTEPEPDQTTSWLIVAAALVLLVVVAATGWWLRDNGIIGPSDETPPQQSDTPTPEAQPDTQPETQPPPELLSNEERVLRLLEQRGGRIKQQEVVAQLDWTEAKTSQVVSGLREEEDIDVFRIGRENVLSLPDDHQESSDTTSAHAGDTDTTEDGADAASDS